MLDPLPLDPYLDEIVATVAERRSLVLSASPGSGKTTRLAPALARSGVLKSDQAIVVLEPRRVAARAAAARIAYEQGVNLGNEVGYHVRDDRRYGPNTKIRVVTEGILNRQIVADPFLEGVGAVVLDEFHERSVHTDLAIALCRMIRAEAREDLVVVVMSATLDAEPIARFLGDCPILNVPGRSHPVAIEYRETSNEPLEYSIKIALEDVLKRTNEQGDILVFLPGMREIERTARSVAGLAELHRLTITTLHGSLSAETQDRALRPAPGGFRKVVLATNIAETSLTIDGVTTVIDCGKARIASFDPVRGLDRLETRSISRASAAQRAGRAGRTAPGACLRLYSQRSHARFQEYESPEIKRVDLCSTILAIHELGIADIRGFSWFDPPPEESIAGAEKLLIKLSALGRDSRTITPLGRRIASIPVHPRLGRLLVEASDWGVIEQGAAVAAILSEPDILATNRENPGRFQGKAQTRSHQVSDVLVRLDALTEAREARFSPRLRATGIDPERARRVDRVRRDLERIAKIEHKRNRQAPPMKRDESFDIDELILKLVLRAYPDRVARRRPAGSATGVTTGGRGVRLAAESVVRSGDLFVAIDPRDDRRGGVLEARVSIASWIDREWLNELFVDAIRRDRTVHFDPDRRKIIGMIRTFYDDLLLGEDSGVSIDADLAGEALAEALSIDPKGWIEVDESASAWLARLDWLRKTFPESDWPEPTDTALADVIANACSGKTAEAEARRVPLVPLLESLLSYDQIRLMRDLAPETITLPNGRAVRVVYSLDRPPQIAAKIQELFGWKSTPTIAGGRIRVLLEILGPNYRPVQRTDDLAGFWRTTYFQARKDLRGRYPKHAWPDDPLAATPATRPRKP
jgi:ATP-dependent helicase HrpB